MVETRDQKTSIDVWTWALDPDGDLRMGEDGRFVTTEQETAVIQDLLVALATQMGEDRLDPDFGLDTLAAIRSHTHLKRQIRRTIEHDDYRHERVTRVPLVEIDHVPGDRESANVRATIRFDEADEITLLFDPAADTVEVIRT